MTSSDPPVSIYDRTALRGVDIGWQMRLGHVDIREGDEVVVEMVRDAISRNPDQSALIVDIGSGSGVLSERLAIEFPDHRVVANDNAVGNSTRAADRLEGFSNAEVYDQSFSEWSTPTDVFISWGSHHHLPHEYLHQVLSLLPPDGRLIIGDEFCPEYLDPADLAGGKTQLIDGYLFIGEDEAERYRSDQEVPETVAGRETARREALWKWYRFVIDEAVARHDWTVALLELQIARDDLATAFESEHKTSPSLLEHELEDAGFRVLRKRVIGERSAELCSFVIYEAAPARGELGG